MSVCEKSLPLKSIGIRLPLRVRVSEAIAEIEPRRGSHALSVGPRCVEGAIEHCPADCDFLDQEQGKEAYDVARGEHDIRVVT
jgi:hypothetical protein